MASFNRDYFLNGAESNYIDYHKRKYKGLATDIICTFKAKKNDIVLDFGCATGNLVTALQNKCDIYGTDISRWAINYAIINNGLAGCVWEWNDEDQDIIIPFIDYIIMLDVLEHMKLKNIRKLFKSLEHVKKIIVRIPVKEKRGTDFFLECSRKDKTHKQCQTKGWWRKLFMHYGFNNIKTINRKNIYDSPGVLAWMIER